MISTKAHSVYLTIRDRAVNSGETKNPVLNSRKTEGIVLWDVS
jgi:hypothetical protein